MKKILGVMLCAGMLAGLAYTPVFASSGIIDRACRTSGRSAASPQLCRCIQQVANSSLSRSERKRAAKFFKDPHMAQQVRQSDRYSDEKMWKRYKAFGQRAKETCG